MIGLRLLRCKRFNCAEMEKRARRFLRRSGHANGDFVSPCESLLKLYVVAVGEK